MPRNSIKLGDTLNRDIESLCFAYDGIPEVIVHVATPDLRLNRLQSLNKLMEDWRNGRGKISHIYFNYIYIPKIGDCPVHIEVYAPEIATLMAAKALYPHEEQMEATREIALRGTIELSGYYHNTLGIPYKNWQHPAYGALREGAPVAITDKLIADNFLQVGHWISDNWETIQKSIRTPENIEHRRFFHTMSGVRIDNPPKVKLFKGNIAVGIEEPVVVDVPEISRVDRVAYDFHNLDKEWEAENGVEVPGDGIKWGEIHGRF